MKIKCIYNNLNKIKTNERINQIFRISDGVLNLDVGKEYVVHAVVFDRDEPWFYIYLDDEAGDFDFDDTPNAYPASLFEVVNPDIPTEWQYSNSGGGNFKGIMVGPKEWLQDKNFYLNAVEEEQDTLTLLNKIRKRNLEFHNE